MANETSKDQEILERATQATTKRIKVRLNEITFDTDRYCHRENEALHEDSLRTLMDSLILEGLQVPIEIYVNPKGQKVLIKGHRRVTACQTLAAKHTPGFTDDMEVEAIQVLDVTPEDLLIRSVADNEVRVNLSRVGRIRVAKKLNDAGVQDERSARALCISLKSYQRDVLIARHSWMFQHVIDDSIAPTTAYNLLNKADEVGRLKELREDVDAWIAAQKRKIREKEKLRKAQDTKELKPAEKNVKRYLPDHLVSHWLDLLAKGERFDEDAQWNFGAGINKEAEELTISSVKLKLSKDPLDRIAKVACKLSQVVKQLRPYIEKRKEAEGHTKAGSAESPYDLELLRELGMDDMADDLEEQLRSEESADGEDDPAHGQTEERSEEDLVDAIETPQATGEAGTKATATPEAKQEGTNG